MAEQMNKEDVKQAMYKMVKDAQGQKKLKPMELRKDIVKIYGDRGVDKQMCKDALKELMNEGKLVYTYYGSSFVELPGEEEKGGTR